MPFPISIEAAEALAIKWGIITALEIGLLGFSIVSNSASIVNSLNNKIRGFCECGIILDEILNLLGCNSFEGLCFMPRGTNDAQTIICNVISILTHQHSCPVLATAQQNLRLSPCSAHHT